jgi:hypothetical protein
MNAKQKATPARHEEIHVYLNQLVLSEKGVEDNIKFLKAIYASNDFSAASKKFDLLDCSVSFARQDDTGMTISRFAKLIGERSHIVFHSDIIDPFKGPILYYTAIVSKVEPKQINRFMFFECPYTRSNFEVMSRLYREAFGLRLEDEPIRKGFRDYYKELLRKNQQAYR